MRRWVLPFVAWFLLGSLGLLAVAMAFDLTAVKDMGAVPELPDPVLRILIVIQPAVLLAFGVGIGVRLADRVGLGSVLTSWVRGEPGPVVSAERLGWAGGIGLGVGAGIVAADAALAPLTGLPLGDGPAGWSGVAQALLYGGIGEELMMRYGLVTLLVWLGSRLFASRPAGLYWVAIGLAAVLFAAGHLPAMAMAAELTPAVVWRTLALNAVPGLLFGWLYWRRGLEYAMLAHMTTHMGMWAARLVI